jgi:hypothetical protein
MTKWHKEIKDATGNFSTPDRGKTVTLLARVGFDPLPAWTWPQRGGRGKAPVTVASDHVAQVLNQWLQVRHALAHGQATLKPLVVLQAVRDPKSSPALRCAPPLRLADAEACMRFSARLPE